MNHYLRHSITVIVIAALVVIAVPVGAQVGAQGDGRSASGPRVITGSHTTTNPIYPTIGAQTSVLLYDMTGLVRKDFDFEPPPETQVLGTLTGDIMGGAYTLTLPETPNGVWHDFDGDAASPPAVQVFVPATFIEFRGDDYMNRGETLLGLSAELDPMSFDVTGGYVVVWAASDGEQFPAGFGADGTVFTADDPLLTLPAGWSVVALNTEPFTLLRDEQVELPVVEGMGALHDYSAMSYADAWDALFARTRDTYPFTADKSIDWDAVYDTITPLIDLAQRDLDFHLIIARFGAMIPDTHIGYVSLPVLQEYMMGGIGVAGVAVTVTGEVVITQVSPLSPAGKAGIAPGDVLVTIGGEDALTFLDRTPLLLSSASTPHSRRYLQAATMLQGPVGTQIDLTWRSQATGQPESQQLTRVMDISAIMLAFGGALLGDGVVSGALLDSGIGYIRVASFVMDVSAANALFKDTLQDLVDAGAQGIIIDVRGNSGGLLGLAMAMAGTFFPGYEQLLDLYYADGEGGFAYRGKVEILAGDMTYDGPVAVLVDEMTGSAGDIFAYAMTQHERAIVVGHTPTGGFTGEVGDGQYALPGGLSIQIPTGRPVHPVTGDTLLEGTGVAPDILVPLTVESVRSPEDEVLQAAEQALLAAQQ